jgi:hypothetical protein
MTVHIHGKTQNARQECHVRMSSYRGACFVCGRGAGLLVLIGTTTKIVGGTLRTKMTILRKQNLTNH